MTEARTRQLKDLGQSVWLDFIRRDLIISGKLKKLIKEDGVSGLTSNLTAFKEALLETNDYDEECRELVKLGKSAREIFEHLARQDIEMAADVLKPVYEETAGVDGYVCLEISPSLTYDTESTVKEAKRLFEALGRENVMIKIPATSAGIEAMRRLVVEGVNVNVTLLFSLKQYDRVAVAYLEGLEDRARKGGNLTKIASVASIFLSQIDREVNQRIDELLSQLMEANKALKIKSLRGQTAIATAKVIYERFKNLFTSNRFKKLAERGARVQRPLWVGIETKDSTCSGVKYVEQLIGSNTVVAVPEKTLRVLRQQARVGLTLERAVDLARLTLNELIAIGVDLKAIYEDLQLEGMQAFENSYNSLIQAIEEKRKSLEAA
jgi:transaldolase